MAIVARTKFYSPNPIIIPSNLIYFLAGSFAGFKICEKKLFVLL